MRKSIFQVCFLIFVLIFTACEETAIVHDLNERDANEIIVLLAKNQISAKKEQEEKNQEVFWKILVDPDQTVLARSILVANNLPKVRQGGLKGICEDTSMIVTEETEKCRKLLAYKGEIINSLESIPGVVSADVVLNIPETEEFPDENTPISRPTAAVTLKYLTDANVRTKLTEGKIQEFVANSISGMDARDVTVIISYLEQKIDTQFATIVPAQDPNINGSDGPSNGPNNGSDENTVSEDDLVTVAGIKMDERSAKKFKVIAGGFLGLLLLLAFAFIFALFKMSRLRKQASVSVVTEDSQEAADQKLLEA